MDLLITVSKQNSEQILLPLLNACNRHTCDWEVFLTDEAVRLLNHPQIAKLLQNTNAIACHDSWQRFTTGTECPVALGSQTNHSEMIARANRVISL